MKDDERLERREMIAALREVITTSGISDPETGPN